MIDPGISGPKCAESLKKLSRVVQHEGPCMRNFCLISMAENSVWSEVTLFERQKSPIMPHAYELCFRELLPWMLEERELVKT